MSTTKGCETLLDTTRKLSRLEKKFSNLQRKQEETLAHIRQEKKETRKAIVEERLSFIARTIKQTGFPVDKPAILIGAILAAKEKLESSNCAAEINHYIELYNDFTAKHVSSEEGADGDALGQEEEVTESGGYRE